MQKNSLKLKGLLITAIMSVILFLCAVTAVAETEDKTALPTSAYPIIFVHGLNSNADSTWYMIDSYLRGSWGWTRQVVDVCLKADRVNASNCSSKEVDVKLITTNISTCDYYLINYDVDFEGGRRAINDDNYALTYALMVGGSTEIWHEGTNHFFDYKTGDILRIKDEYLKVNNVDTVYSTMTSLWLTIVSVQRGLYGTTPGTYAPLMGVYNVSCESNQSGIVKQAWGLKQAIDKVKIATGASKVILVGHSMGGLAARCYAQRFSNNDVAKIVTIGSPNLGAIKEDIFMELLVSIKIQSIDTKSEGMRDCAYNYDGDSYQPSIQGVQDLSDEGIFFTGGAESSIPDNRYFNKDVDANGSESDNFVGVNWAPPSNLEYYFYTAMACYENTDGIVQVPRQWLDLSSYGSNYIWERTTAPNTYGIYAWHADGFQKYFPGPDYCETYLQKEIIRAIDEPDTSIMAYNMPFDKTIGGTITYQGNGSSTDKDLYKIVVDYTGVMALTVNGQSSGLNTMKVYDQSNNLISTSDLSTYPYTKEISVGNGIYYICITGTADYYTWSQTYNLRASRVTSITITETLNPSYTTSGATVAVTGRATYNTGNPVVNSTVTIQHSQGSWSTTTNTTGDYSYNITAPTTSQNINVSIVNGTLTGTNYQFIEINNAVPGHDYKVELLTVDDTQIMPGGTFSATAQIRNIGIYSETNVPVTFKLYGPTNTVVESYTDNLSLAASGTDTKTHSFGGSSTNAVGNYILEVRTNLATDYDPSNNVKTKSVYVGVATNYPEYKITSLTALAPTKSYTTSTGYTILYNYWSISSSLRYADVTITKGSYSGGGRIYEREMKLYDQNQFALVLEMIDTGNDDAYFTWGEPVNYVSVQPSCITVDAGKIDTFKVLASAFTSINYNGSVYGPDGSIVKPWLSRTTHGNYLDLKVTVPTTATIKGYAFWPKFSLNSGAVNVIHICSLKVHKPHQVQAISIQPTTGGVDTSGKTLNISGIFNNIGGYDEQQMTVKMTISGPSGYSKITSQALPLLINQSDTAVFYWNTLGLTVGQYNVRLSAQVTEDIDTTNNYLTTSVTLTENRLFVTPLTWSAPDTMGISNFIRISNSGTSTPINYIVTTDSSWVYPSKTEGITVDSIQISVLRNASGVARIGNVYIYAPGVYGSPDTIEITQPSTSDYLSASISTWYALGTACTSKVITVYNSGNANPINYFLIRLMFLGCLSLCRQTHRAQRQTVLK